MPKDRACANTPVMPSFISRRAVLAGLPVSGVALASPPESEIMTLFRKYEACEALIGKLDHAPDHVVEAHYDRLFAIADQIMALPSQSATDFAAKAIVASCHGTATPCWDTSPVWAEARALVGGAGIR